PEIVAMGKWHETYAFRVGPRGDFRFLAEVLGGTYPVPLGSQTGAPVTPREGITSTVGLLDERGTVRLRQGGLSESKFNPSDPDAGSETEVALGLVPYLAHPAPRTALVIGHGAGWTVETLLASRLERVDVAELEPAVLDVVEAYRGPLEVRRAGNARLHVTDGRLLLREAAAEGGRYDLVVSQPSHPWVPGAGHLFTSDAYRLARSALNEGGVFAQWLNVFNMDADLLRTALASFATVFPEAWGFLFHDEIVLVGFRDAGRIDPARWRAAFDREPVGDRARAAGIDGPGDLLRRIVFDGAGLRRLAGSAPPSTDDEPRLETGLAWSIFTGAQHPQKEKGELVRTLQSAFPPDFVTLVPDAAGRERLLAESAASAVAAGGDMARRWARDVPFDGGVLGRRARAKERLAASNATGLADAARRRLREDAVSLLQEALRLRPDDGGTARELLDALQQAGRGADAVATGADLVARRPDDGPLVAEHARALVGAGREQDAREAFERAMAATSPPAPAGTGMRLARLHLSATPPRSEAARDALRADASLDNDREALETLLGLEIETSDDPATDTEEVARARKRLAEAERAAGVAALARARRNLYDDVATGLAAAREATELRPDDPVAWRWRGWLELRDGSFEAAATSLAKAVDLAEDRPTEWRRARAWLRLFGRDPAELDSAAAVETAN
ncbi:MAG TPA: hypothetical protein VND21_01970, partial [Planctomycetota bacterium]|nr:hypothetical protein [Planctomycetota bacterium]